MSSYLPPGVTDSMCEPYDPTCANCGCYSSNHYTIDDEDTVPEPLSRDSESYYGAVEHFANGKVSHACDSLLGKKRQCGCTEFEDGPYESDCDEYEPEPEDYSNDRD